MYIIESYIKYRLHEFFSKPKYSIQILISKKIYILILLSLTSTNIYLYNILDEGLKLTRFLSLLELCTHYT